jgi:glycosyltransferase involved in cell wall biosynthesis
MRRDNGSPRTFAPAAEGAGPHRWPQGKPRIGVFVVSYHASSTIADVLRRIKPETWNCITEVFIFDDASADDTCQVATSHKLRHNLSKVRVFHNQVNLGYGGNQKRGYRYARQQGFDIVVLLHGDGQYAPEAMDDLLDPLVNGEADAVFGSRMMIPGGARAGGMPLYKYAGNKILTGIQNLLLGERMTEYHSGYRAYNVHALAQLPLLANANDFHFDNEIIVQLLEGGFRIKEVPIPTYYGNEICRVNGMKYAWNVLLTNCRYRLHKAGLLYARQFDLRRGEKYTYKHDSYSSHRRIVDLVGPAPHSGDSQVVDIGCGAGFLAGKLVRKGHRVDGVDVYDSAEARNNCHRFVVADIERDLGMLSEQKADVLVFADVLEHTREPEQILLKARRHLTPNGRIVASTGNVAHLFIRLSLLLGFFNYTERGILDRTHCRLFTVRGFRRLFRDTGFRVQRVRYCPIPFENLFPGRDRLSRLLSRLNMLFVWLWPPLFAYQTVVEAVSDPAPSALLRQQEILKPDYMEWDAQRVPPISKVA